MRDLSNAFTISFANLTAGVRHEATRARKWHTPGGEIAIVPDEKGRFDLKLDGQNVGNYNRVDFALDDAVEGSHFGIPSGLRTSELSPPPLIGDWTFVPPHAEE